MTIDYAAIAPEVALTATALIVLLADLVLKGDAKRLINPLVAIGTIVAIVFTVSLWDQGRSTFDGMFVVNNYAVLFKLMFLGSLLAILGISYRFFAEGRYFQGEYYFLLLCAFIGMLIMPSARDLILLFVALETVSIPAFVLAGLRKRDLYGSEAAIKFFLIGVISVSIMLFGMSMVYGLTGSTSLTAIADAIASQQQTPLLLGSVLLIIVGFGFKVSAVPFHFWAPDTYAGSPMPVTAMLAVASKAAGFAGLVNVTFIAFEPLASTWAPAMGVIAVVTMTLGNLTALQQRDIVRLLAYSSIGQAGYMLVPFGLAVTGDTALNDQAVQSVLFYLIAYAVMNIGAFGVAIAVHRRTGERAIADYAGLGQRAPMLAIGLSAFLLSLGGAAPLIGFWAKFYIFVAAADAANWTLAIFVVVNAVIAMFYYLKIVKIMWMDAPREAAPRVQAGFSLSFAVGVLTVAALVLGVLPGLIADYTSLGSLLAVR